MTRVLLLTAMPAQEPPLAEAIVRRAPDVQVLRGSEAHDDATLASIEVGLGWRLPPRVAPRLSGLRWLCSMAAGVEKLLVPVAAGPAGLLAAVRRLVELAGAHDDGEGGAFALAGEPFVPVDDPLVAVLHGRMASDEKDDVKATAARRWVQAVNTWGGLGPWAYAICHDANSLKSQLADLAIEHGLDRA